MPPTPGRRGGIVGVPISDIQPPASGGATPYSWNISGLPAGLTVTATAWSSGTPTAAGSSLVTATVTDAATPTPTDSVEFNDHREPGAAPISRSPRSRATARPPTWSVTR